MTKIVLLAVVLCITLRVSAQSALMDTLKYRISLKDKHATTYSLERPREFLSEKSMLRRQKQNLPLDSTDLPVCRAYVEAIKAKGVRVVVTGKWDNFVTVSCNDSTLIDEIARLPFVHSTEKVWKWAKVEKVSEKEKKEAPVHDNGFRQMEVNSANLLHDAGFKGQGMTIAVIDDGFNRVNKIKEMANTRILGTKDFVNPASDIYAEGGHGTVVMSCMSMNQPAVMTGTAPEASYWLLRSEDNDSEHLVEQDYWSAAIEFADSVGVDLVNTSLGYYTFDDPTKVYRYRDLNGHYALMSRQASKASDKGMVVVCSAGNSGAESWKKISSPADAYNVLAVGAVGEDGVLANFSSVGNTADGRVKPDVVAVGVGVTIMGTEGKLRKGDGTSFSSPIMCGMVACLWQACPELTAKELIELVRQSGNRADFPDNIYGYGIPDMWKAYSTARKSEK